MRRAGLYGEILGVRGGGLEKLGAPSQTAADFWNSAEQRPRSSIAYAAPSP
jgi:hypothetical protein